ncbi:hypothetical protein Ddc_14584 [Ditylenchus destructor]|nr:hypothetical protein Ddc_14584 [Ditylenchus destructor]
MHSNRRRKLFDIFDEISIHGRILDISSHTTRPELFNGSRFGAELKHPEPEPPVSGLGEAIVNLTNGQRETKEDEKNSEICATTEL